MSKELIERMRADAESTDDIGLCADPERELIAISEAAPAVTVLAATEPK